MVDIGHDASDVSRIVFVGVTEHALVTDSSLLGVQCPFHVMVLIRLRIGNLWDRLVLSWGDPDFVDRTKIIVGWCIGLWFWRRSRSWGIGLATLCGLGVWSW